MKDRISIFFALIIVIFVALGCNLTERLQKSVTGDEKTSSQGTNDNRSIVDKTIDVAVDDESTGVPECDQAMKTIDDEITRETAKSDDSWIVRGTRRFMFTEMKKGLRNAIKENENDANSNLNKQKIAETCSDFQKKIDVEIKKDIADGK